MTKIIREIVSNKGNVEDLMASFLKMEMARQ